MPIRPVRNVVSTSASMKVPSCWPRRSPHRSRTTDGQCGRGDDPAADRVLEVVADVGDPVGPADHLAFGGGRGRPRPRVVADAVEGLLAQVERGQRDVGTPGRMIEPPVDERGEGVLAGVPTRTVPAVVAQGDGLGEGHVQPAGAGDAHGHLGHLERVGQPGPLVVVGEDEDLGLAGQPPERRGVQDPVAVPLEAGPPRGPAPRSGPGCRRPSRTGGSGCQLVPLELLAARPVRGRPPAASLPVVAWLSRWANVTPSTLVAGHGRGPPPGPLVRVRPVTGRRTGHTRTVPVGVTTGRTVASPRGRPRGVASVLASGGARIRYTAFHTASVHHGCDPGTTGPCGVVSSGSPDGPTDRRDREERARWTYVSGSCSR